MVETDAHRVDHVMPQLSVRPWVLSVPKRVRDFLQNDPAVETMALPIFLRALEQGWRQCPSRRPPRADAVAERVGPVCLGRKCSWISGALPVVVR